MKAWWQSGIQSVILRVFIPDTSQLGRTGARGLTNSSTGLIISTIADTEAAATTYTQADGTIDTIAALGTFAAPSAGHCRFKEVDSTNFPGWYELQIADARWAVSGARSLLVSLPAVAGLNTGYTWVEVELTAVNPFDAVAFGLSRIDAAVSSRMATFSLPANFSNLAIDGSGRVTVGALVNGAIAAATFAANAITSTVLADGALTGSKAASGFFDGVRASIGMASANLDSQLAAILAAIGSISVDPASIWNYLTSALTTAGSIGKLLVDKLGLITAGSVTVNTGTQPQTGSWTLYDQDYDTASGQTLPTWTSADWASYDLLHAQSITGYWKLNSANEVAFPAGAFTCPDETTVQLTALTRTQAQAVNAYGSGIGFMIRAVLSVGKGGGVVDLVNTSMAHKNYAALATQP